MVNITQEQPSIEKCRLLSSNRVQLHHSCEAHKYRISKPFFCQTLGLVLRLRVDFVLPLSQEEEEQEEKEQKEQPPTKIYQKGVY